LGIGSKEILMGYRKIVCGVTASTHSQKAALEAARLAKENGAELIYVYAVDLTFLASGNTGSLSTDVVRESLENLGDKILEMAEKIAASQGMASKKVLREGSVLDVLKEIIVEEKADMLVLGHENRTFFEKALFKGDAEEHALELQARTGAEIVIIK
jgi:nucleotide-binding universal stress UspA family protein